MNAIIRAAFAATTLALSSSTTLAHHGLLHEGCAAGAEFTQGDLIVSAAYTRAMLPGAKAAGGYLTIANSGTVPDRLTGASSEAAGLIDVHKMSMVDGVMNMEAVDGGLDIPAGGSVSLEPGGIHLMLMQIGTPFEEGQCLQVTLHFVNAGDMPVVLSIGGVAQSGPPMDHDMSGMSSMEGM